MAGIIEKSEDKQRTIEVLAWLMLYGPKPSSSFGVVSFQSDEGPMITVAERERGWEITAAMACGEVPVTPNVIASRFVSFTGPNGKGTLFISRSDIKE